MTRAAGNIVCLQSGLVGAPTRLEPGIVSRSHISFPKQGTTGQVAPLNGTSSYLELLLLDLPPGSFSEGFFSWVFSGLGRGGVYFSPFMASSSVSDYKDRLLSFPWLWR